MPNQLKYSTFFTLLYIVLLQLNLGKFNSVK